MNTVSYFKSIALVLAIIGNVKARETDTEDKPRTVDPTGTWVWEQEFGGNKIGRELRLKLQDKELSGTYKSIFPNPPENAPPGLSDPVKIANAKLDVDEISFDVVRSFNGNEFTITFSGVIAGDELAGFTEMDFGGEIREFEWMAKRVVTMDDVVGKWTVKLETPRGEIAEAFTITKEQEGKQLKGTFHSSVFGEIPISDIVLSDKKLNFVVELKTDDGRAMRAKYDTEPRGGKIAGLIAVNFGDNELEIPFQGQRVEETKEKQGEEKQ